MEEKSKDLEDRTFEITQKKKEQRIRKSEESLCDQWEYIKRQILE